MYVAAVAGDTGERTLGDALRNRGEELIDDVWRSVP
jgi:hypothetical protein